MDGTVSMEAGPPEGPGGSETMLVAEDNPAVRELVRDILVLHGYTVMCAADGYEGMRLVHEHSGPIDLLSTDVEMPGMHGPELARRLDALRSGIKVLHLSGRPVRELGARGLLDLQAHFLPRPFRVGRLARRVRDLLDDTPRDRAAQGGPQATAPGQGGISGRSASHEIAPDVQDVHIRESHGN